MLISNAMSEDLKRIKVVLVEKNIEPAKVRDDQEPVNA